MPVSTVFRPSLPYLLKRAQQACKSALDEGLRPLGVSSSQIAVLRRLDDAPGLSGAELARRCWVTAQSMNELLAAMDAAGLVSRQADPTHGRIVRTTMTEAGRRLLVRCNAVIDEVTERMLSGLSEQDRRDLADLLERCATSLETPPAPGRSPS